MKSFKVIALFVLQLAFMREITGNPDAKRLYDDLLSNYNRLIRPVSNNTQTVLVKLGLRLSQLIDLVSSTVFHRTNFRFLNWFSTGFFLILNDSLDLYHMYFISSPYLIEFKGSNFDNKRMAGACKFLPFKRYISLMNLIEDASD